MLSISSRCSIWSLSLLALLVLGMGACTSTEQGAGSGQGDGDRLVFDELSISLSGRSVYDVIEEVNPQWLRKRGRNSINNPEDVKVYLEGTEYGSIESLRQISAENVESVEHLNSGEAQFRFGPGNTQGAIVVTLRSS